MSRGARQLTKKEKDKLELLRLVDATQWRLTGTLVPHPKRISRSDLKSRIERAIAPKSGFHHGRRTITINCNVFAEEILPQDGEENGEEK
jgi:hypothetical protein